MTRILGIPLQGCGDDPKKCGNEEENTMIEKTSEPKVENENVVFFVGKLAHMQIESESSIEEIEQGIGVSFEGARIEEFKFGNGYEIIFNEKFAD